MATPGSTGAITRSFNCSKATNPNYRLIVTCPGQGVEIITDIPEEMGNSVGSEWENKLPSSISSYSNAAESISKLALGTSAALQYATKQVWVNSSPIELPVSMVFDAVSKSGFEEVVKPIRIIESLAMPEVYGGFLYAPGPSGSERNLSCTVTIGKQVSIPEMILVSAQSSFSTRLDSNGHPIAGKVDCTFRTSYVLDRKEWLKLCGILDFG